MTAFINQDNVKGKSFAAPYPGKILPIDLTEFQGKFICQKFFLLQRVVSGIEFSKIRRGFFGGEGFYAKIEETDWHVCTLWRNLSKERTKNRRSPESRYRLHVGFTKDVDYDIEFIGGIKNPFWWRRSIHTLRPWNCLHTIFTFSRLADIASAPKAGGKQ
jgi:hypothetical protein